MRIEQLATNAINYIKQHWTLPDKGFVAGGAIANLIWEEISGVKAVINDIDIFVLENILEKCDQVKDSYFSYRDNERVAAYDGYDGLRFIDIQKNFYSITSSEKKGMLNYIYYDSSTYDRKIVLDSFDVNCVMIGYLIEEDRFIWTDEYEKFIEHHKIQIVNAITPHHTAIRIVKKSDEMQIPLEPKELEILECVISTRPHDVRKNRFMERYVKLFVQYRDKLPMFDIISDLQAMAFLKSKGIEEHLFMLKTHEDKSLYTYGYKGTTPITHDIIFYFRNIRDNEKLNYAWLKLSDIFVSNDYISQDYEKEDVDFLHYLYTNFPEAILNLRGSKFIEQVNFIRDLLRIFDDKSIVIALLQTNKINIDIDIHTIDDTQKLLLELSVRKYITSDAFTNRVESVFNKEDVTFF